MSTSFAEQQLAALNVNGVESLIAGFEAACQEHGDRPVFSAMGNTISFAELDAHSLYLARYLRKGLGLSEGDRVAIQLPNINQYPIAAWAVLRAGLVIVNTNPLYTERELIHQFSDSGSKVMISLQSTLGSTARIINETPVSHVISVGVAPSDDEPAMFDDLSVGLSDFAAALGAGARLDLELTRGSMHDLAVLQYTGGTTGVPKGAMLSQGNLFAGMRQSFEKFPNKDPQGEVLLAPMPLYHIYGFTAHCISGVLNGRLSVLIPNPRDVDSIIDAWKAHRVTSLCGINTLFAAMLAHPEFSKLDFSTLQAVIAGGTTLVEELAVAWEEATGCQIFEGYGLSETTATATVNSEDERVLGSVGVALSGLQIKLVDESGAEVGEGDEGELLIRGANVTQGYWQRPEATAEAIDADGWFRTGDVAVRDEAGFIRIVDRLKDMIIVSGFNVYPNEIEAVVYAHPDIVECAAVGVADAKTGEAVKLYVVSSSQDLSAERLIEFCRRDLAAYKVPKQIEFKDDLPKSNVGKILRRELRDLA